MSTTIAERGRRPCRSYHISFTHELIVCLESVFTNPLIDVLDLPDEEILSGDTTGVDFRWKRFRVIS